MNYKLHNADRLEFWTVQRKDFEGYDLQVTFAFAYYEKTNTLAMFVEDPRTYKWSCEMVWRIPRCKGIAVPSNSSGVVIFGETEILHHYVDMKTMLPFVKRYTQNRN